MKKIIDFGIIVFFRCEQIDGKIDILKSLNNFFKIYSENLQTLKIITLELFNQGKKEFLGAVILMIKRFQIKIKSLVHFFLNFLNVLLLSENLIQVVFKIKNLLLRVD